MIHSEADSRANAQSYRWMEVYLDLNTDYLVWGVIFGLSWSEIGAKLLSYAAFTRYTRFKRSLNKLSDTSPCEFSGGVICHRDSANWVI